MKAREIAAFINGQIIGNPDTEITKPGYLSTAEKDDLAYCFLKNDKKDLEAISRTNAGIVICQEQLQEKVSNLKVKPTLILSASAKYDFARVLHNFFVEETIVISPDAYIGKKVRLGDGVDIHSGVVIYNGTILGNRIIVRANAVLGTEGLDYGKSQNGDLVRVPHMSSLIVEDDVDIGSNTTVQKGILRPTIIGKGSKIGPNCNIGHEVKLGKSCIITGMTLIAGATEIGDHTFVAPHSTIKNSITIGKNVFVGIGSLVLSDIPDNTTVVGRPAVEIEGFRRTRKRMKDLLGET